MIRTISFALTFATFGSAAAAEIDPDHTLFPLAVLNVETPSREQAWLCVEEPFFGLGDPLYVVSEGVCNGNGYIYYPDDALFLEMQEDGIIDPALPLVPEWPETARSRSKIAWLDLKSTLGLLGDDTGFDAEPDEQEPLFALPSFGAMIGLPQYDDQIKFVVLAGGLFLAMRKYAVKLVDVAFWFINRFRSKGARVGQLRAAGAGKPSKATETIMKITAHLVAGCGAYHDDAVPTMGQIYTDLTGDTLSADRLSALFKDMVPETDLLTDARRLKGKSADRAMTAALTVARVGGTLTGAQVNFLQSLAQATGRKLPQMRQQAVPA